MPKLLQFPKLEGSYPLPAGDAGTARTIQFMRGCATGTDGAKHPKVRALALQIVRGLGPREYSRQIDAVYNWVKQNVEFRGEYRETLQTPVATLNLGAGDCDDHVTLLGALLLTLGFQVRPQTVAKEVNSDFAHVYLEVLDRSTGQWVPLDTTVINASPGWSPAEVRRRRAWRTWGQTGRQFAGVSKRGMGDFQLDLTQVLQPIAQGVGQRIQYGGANSAQLGINIGQGGSNVPSWLWMVGGFWLLYEAVSSKRHRRN